MENEKKNIVVLQIRLKRDLRNKLMSLKYEKDLSSISEVVEYLYNYFVNSQKKEGVKN